MSKPLIIDSNDKGGPYTMAHVKTGDQEGDLKGYVDVFPVKQIAFIRFIQEDKEGYYCKKFWRQASEHDKDSAFDFLNKQTGNSIYTRLFYNRKSLHSDLESYPLDDPVINVNWYEANAFAKWRGARLLKANEWEKLITNNLLPVSLKSVFICSTKFGTSHEIGSQGFLEWTNTKKGINHKIISLTNPPVLDQMIRIKTETQRSTCFSNILTFRCIKEV